ncbi:MAG: glycosyltransferase [Oscillospiraceae bacterium]|nr:glycosyltransferase [Oscillospiraceae bacterium]
MRQSIPFQQIDVTKKVLIYIGIGFPGGDSETQGLPLSGSKKAIIDIVNLKGRFGNNFLCFLKSNTKKLGGLYYAKDTLEFDEFQAHGIGHFLPAVNYFSTFIKTLLYALFFFPNLLISNHTIKKCVKQLIKLGVPPSSIIFVAYSPTLSHTYPCYRAKKRFGCKYIEILDCGPVFKDEGLQRDLTLKIFKNHDGVITYVAGSAIDFAPDKPYAEVFFPIPDQLLPLFTNDQKTAKTPLTDRKPIIAYTGHLSSVYQLEEIIKVIKTTGKRYRWKFAGYGPLSEELSALSKDDGYDVEFYGLVNVAESVKIMMSADLLICPKGGDSSELDKYKSRYAASGKLIEYLCTGVPVLASDIPAFSEQIKPYFALIPQNISTKELCEKLEVIFDESNYSELLTKAQDGRQFALTNCTLDVYNKTTLEFILNTY